jgi:hypothetical protein
MVFTTGVRVKWVKGFSVVHVGGVSRPFLFVGAKVVSMFCCSVIYPVLSFLQFQDGAPWCLQLVFVSDGLKVSRLCM